MKGAKRNMECVYITGKSGTEERSLQNKVDMLYRHNDILMNEIDRKCG